MMFARLLHKFHRFCRRQRDRSRRAWSQRGRRWHYGRGVARADYVAWLAIGALVVTALCYPQGVWGGAMAPYAIAMAIVAVLSTLAMLLAEQQD